MTEFSNILKECRNKIGLTQYAIAKNMNIAKAEYAMYENVREVISDKISDFIENADMYDLFLLEWKLENLKRRK